ncbi:universal stress protein [Streptomyces canus]|uniref:universal stress protein n=1 Tax=Streptomyces canus TaxID=58343 RepID=UPI000AD574BD|nr:universal stress protein [Streptomyces canus]
MALPLVVGIDGSESSLEAVDLAAAGAARPGLSLHLVHAAAGDRGPFDVISAGSERAGERNPKVRLSSEVLHEDVAAALLDKRRDAFALVLGSRGLGDLADMLGAALQVSLREAQVRRCRLTDGGAFWNPPPRALNPRPTPSSYALEAHRRPPWQMLDDALRGMTQQYRDARASPEVCSSARRAEHCWTRRRQTCWSSAHEDDRGARDCGWV